MGVMGLKESREAVESSQAPSGPGPGPVQEGADEVVEEKNVLPVSEDNNQKLSHSRSPPAASKVQDPATEKSSGGSIDRDAGLARVATDKRMALVKAWEEGEKTKADNKANRKLAVTGSWENSKKASLEDQLRKIEEKLEKKKAEYAEKMQNKMAEIHRAAEEKKATVVAKRDENFLKVEEEAAKFRATGHPPKKKFLGCF